MLAYDLPVRADPPRRQAGSRCFDALVYQRALFPLMPGRFAIPPAQLVYSLPLSASFFSREETHELQTDSTVIVAVEPPSQGRPADFGGAVGSLRVAARLDTAGSRVGDPVLLTVRVSGTGNVKLFPRPAVGIALGLARERRRARAGRHHDAEDRRLEGIRLGAHAARLPASSTCRRSATRISIPIRGATKLATTASTHVHVGRGSLASADTARTGVAAVAADTVSRRAANTAARVPRVLGVPGAASRSGAVAGRARSPPARTQRACQATPRASSAMSPSGE